MRIDEIKKNYSTEIMRRITEPDNSGRGWVCPLCGAGKGKHGTGIVEDAHRPGYFKCFSAGCDFYGDILELLGVMQGVKGDTVKEIQEAERILGVDLMDKKQDINYRQGTAMPTADAVFGNGSDKNMVQTDVNKPLPSETVTDAGQAEKIVKYINGCAERLETSVPGLTYLAGRGISAETAKRFGLGYTERYNDTFPKPCIIIPTGKYSYTARTTNDDADKVRKGKATERAGVFGIDCLKNNPAIVYVVEGEIDALSAYEVGCDAIATGGGTSRRSLVDEIKHFPNLQTTFIVLPDNDRNEDGTPDMRVGKGYQEGQSVYNDLLNAGIPCALYDTSNPDKWDVDVNDLNDLLQKDRGRCTSFLKGVGDRLIGEALGRSSLFLDEFVRHNKGNTPPVPTTFEPFDDILDGGLRPGLITVGAISSLGKTTFCLNIAERIARAGHDVIFFSLEMSKYELISKIISCKTIRKCFDLGMPTSVAKTNIGVSDFERWKRYNDEEKFVLQQCFEEYESGAGRNLYIKDGLHEYGTAEIRRDVKRHIDMTGRVPVVIVDYVQILKTPDVRLTDKQKTDVNILELKLLSRDYNVPLIGISSFNRENYSTPVTMSAFKESGVIEYTSDILIGIQYNGLDYMDGEKDAQRASRVRTIIQDNIRKANVGEGIELQVKVLKNRSGRKSSTVLKYFPMFNCYEEMNKVPFGL